MKLKFKMEKKKANDWMSQSQKNPINDCIMPQTKDKKDIVLVFLTTFYTHPRPSHPQSKVNLNMVITCDWPPSHY